MNKLQTKAYFCTLWEELNDKQKELVHKVFRVVKMSDTSEEEDAEALEALINMMRAELVIEDD